MKDNISAILIVVSGVITASLVAFGKHMNDATFLVLVSLAGASAIGGLVALVPWSEFRWKK